MQLGCNWFVSIFIILSVITFSAHAVEPDAPDGLITAAEANIIKLRIRLEQLKRPKRQEVLYERNGLQAFYALRRNGLVWFEGNKINAHGKQAMKVLQDAAKWGLDPDDFKFPAYLTQNAYAASSIKDKIEAELRISLAILRYARHARGGQINPSRLSLDFDRKPQLEDPQYVLEHLLTAQNPRDYLEGLHPQHSQFQRLRKKYTYLLHKSSNRKLKRREWRLLKKLRLNMHLWRWMPRDMGKRYVWANIPEYKVRVIDEGQTIFQERVVIGKKTHKTPIFSDEMETVVFQPYWYVPNSIKVKQLLPRLLQGKAPRGYKIAAKFGGQEINPYKINWRRQDIRKYVVYQPPSQRNALGKVKFLFPNKHAVYFHDTPKKHLFRYKQRAFSHGCLRVRNPLNFAHALLSEDRNWKQRHIQRAVARGPENNPVKLKKKVPVHIVYFTTWVENNGKLRVFRDIYGHERLISKGLSGQADAIEPPKKEDLGKTRAAIVAGHSIKKRRYRLTQNQRQKQARYKKRKAYAAKKRRDYAASYRSLLGFTQPRSR